MAASTLLLGILALFLPPLPVVMKRGCGGQFLLNILLLFLAWIPAVIHAWWILAEANKKEKARPSSRHSSSSHREKYHGDGHAAPPPHGAAYPSHQQQHGAVPYHQQHNYGRPHPGSAAGPARY